MRSSTERFVQSGLGVAVVQRRTMFDNDGHCLILTGTIINSYSVVLFHISLQNWIILFVS